ncbi:MAG TPA: efflux RND transporter periplasmic adaptor subunit [Ideonella sp.]|uniref:efflux RND transporter periplasmic adaptor subunit n=1 Tax=Ideonella sp. TaxID=1929293 RepID=UPI002E378608|nr:efflux RND transporter periplasmic adaptor subunit [Ideonella sp.]HEX5687414.1 efflux RND transporter periplasmic adaptor subunit [Ideonella sp.]
MPAEQEASHRALPDWLQGDQRHFLKRRSTWVIAVLALALAAGGVAWWRAQARADAPRYLTEPITRGDIALTVTANGTLQPTRSVNIGSELSGTVSEVLVDVNDRVKKGQVLVRLDTAKLQDQVAKSEAALQSARAGIAQAVATTREAQQAQARLDDVKRISGGKLPAASELDAARATLAKAQAAEAGARADLVQAEATLRTDRTNLGKASIRAPIDGVILTRAVDPGNAVAASLQAVTLFTMAEDLTQMKLSVNVDEADVGQVKEGQTAQFSVSAWPGRKYPARITRVAYGSTTTDNVVTYTTQMLVDNPDLTLRPGMTATAIIAATERKGVLRAPNTAFSFDPNAASGRAGPASGGIVSALMPRPGGQATKRARPTDGAGAKSAGQRRLWVLQNGQPVAIAVTAGLSNGRLTEVSAPELKEGMAVIVDQQSGAKP